MYCYWVLSCPGKQAVKSSHTMVRPAKDPKTSIPKKPQSLVWRHFGDNLDGQHVHCVVCREKGDSVSIKISDFSTKSLWNHLDSFHKKEFKDIKAEEKEKALANNAAVEKAPRKKTDENYGTQDKIKDAFNKMNKYDVNGAKQSNFDKALVEFLADNFVPFEVVNSESFKRLVAELDKRVNAKTARTYSRHMEDMAHEVMEDVKKAIDEFCDASAAITTDLWKSRAKDDYISITVSFVDKLFRLHRFTPFCSPFMDKHTGENIQEVMDFDLEDKLKLPADIPKWGVADNASNMVKAINLSILELYTCCCHTQQLAINDAEECILVGHNPNNIPLANETRWDSTHACMEGVVYHEECLMRLARRGELVVEDIEGIRNNFIPSINDFLMIKAGVQVLQKCKVTTKIFEQEKVPTVPHVIERLYNMDQELDEFINKPANLRNNRKAVKFAEVLRQQLLKENRFPDFGMHRPLNCFGNYLNPSLKGIHLKLKNTLQNTKDLLEE